MRKIILTILSVCLLLRAEGAAQDLVTVTKICTLPACGGAEHETPPATALRKVDPPQRGGEQPSRGAFGDGSKLQGRPDLLPPPSGMDKALRVGSYGAAVFDIVSTQVAINRGGREAIYANANGGVRWGVAIPAKFAPLIVADILEHRGYRKQARWIRVSQIILGTAAAIWNLSSTSGSRR